MSQRRDIPTEPIGPSLTAISCALALVAALLIALVCLIA